MNRLLTTLRSPAPEFLLFLETHGDDIEQYQGKFFRNASKVRMCMQSFMIGVTGLQKWKVMLKEVRYSLSTLLLEFCVRSDVEDV